MRHVRNYAPFEGIGLFALKVCPFAHFLIVRHSVKSRGVGRSPAGHVIVDGPRALDGVAQSGHELYRVQYIAIKVFEFSATRLCD